MLTGEHPALRQGRRFNRLLPSNPRCLMCYAPFKGMGAPIMRLFYSKKPSNLNPRLCNVCDEFARTHQGGAEITLTLFFADVRGSTALAERMSPAEFSNLMNRFYKVATDVLIEADAWIDKLVGDEVIGLFIPGFVGGDHARRAIEAAQELLRSTGHTSNDPWLPVGVGIHTGVAYVGAVGSSGGVTDITALGDAVNTTARLASSAAAGEILVSEAVCDAAGLGSAQFEERTLTLKGKQEPFRVRVLRAEEPVSIPSPSPTAKFALHEPPAD